VWFLSFTVVQLLDIVDLEAGTQVAGGRGYYLKREGVLLNQVRGSMCVVRGWL
jgi:seryl-tRNA synthetase